MRFFFLFFLLSPWTASAAGIHGSQLVCLMNEIQFHAYFQKKDPKEVIRSIKSLFGQAQHSPVKMLEYQMKYGQYLSILGIKNPLNSMVPSMEAMSAEAIRTMALRSHLGGVHKALLFEKLVYFIQLYYWSYSIKTSGWKEGRILFANVYKENLLVIEENGSVWSGKLKFSDWPTEAEKRDPSQWKTMSVEVEGEFPLHSVTYQLKKISQN